MDGIEASHMVVRIGQRLTALFLLKVRCVQALPVSGSVGLQPNKMVRAGLEQRGRSGGGNSIPITSWANQDEAWVDVVHGIRQALVTIPPTS